MNAVLEEQYYYQHFLWKTNHKVLCQSSFHSEAILEFKIFFSYIAVIFAFIFLIFRADWHIWVTVYLPEIEQYRCEQF